MEVIYGIGDNLCGMASTMKISQQDKLELADTEHETKIHHDKDLLIKGEEGLLKVN